MNSTEARIRARDAALRTLTDLTTWIALGAVAAVGVLGGIAAATIPGKASTSSTANSSSSSSSSTSTSSSSSSGFTFPGLQSSSVSSSSSAPVAVSGGSR